MPEQLTKHPEVTLQVLKSAGGAKCGEGAPQTILKSCPADRFCALPGGEVCVYGLPEATRMTQISAAELTAVLPPTVPAAAAAPWGWVVAAVIVGAAVGATLGARLRRR